MVVGAGWCWKSGSEKEDLGKVRTVNLHSSGFEGTSHLYSLLPKFVRAIHVTGAQIKLIRDH